MFKIIMNDTIIDYIKNYDSAVKKAHKIKKMTNSKVIIEDKRGYIVNIFN